MNFPIKIKKIAEWEGCSLHWDEKTDLIKVALPGCEAFNTKCVATYAWPNGKRAIDIDFNYLGSFHEGIALVGVKKKGYGYIDKSMNFITPLKYYRAWEFKNGFGLASVWDQEHKKEVWLFVDKTGKETFFEKEYVDIEKNSEGVFRVSTFSLAENIEGWTTNKLAYHSDHRNNAGLWGYADIAGKEIIKPQYIFAYDFYENGLALVCKGKWEWTNEGGGTFLGKEKKGGYWSKEQLWGMIDKTGKEVVPCKFDEIEYFNYGDDVKTQKYLKAHYGGWKNGKWGIIDLNGNWVIEPIFEALGYKISQDDLFPFYIKDSLEDVPQGVYSIKEKRILLEPKYLDIDFEDDGNLEVEVYDEDLARNVTKIISRTGEPLFTSYYTFIYSRGEYYKTSIRLENGEHVEGLIDKRGNEILPCRYNGEILIEEEKIVFKKNEKYGLMTFDEKIILEPIYDNLWVRGNFTYAVLGKDNDRKLGLFATENGKTLFPTKYNNISVKYKTIIVTDDNSSTLYRIV